jgi:hypothetical protein
LASTLGEIERRRTMFSFYHLSDRGQNPLLNHPIPRKFLAHPASNRVNCPGGTNRAAWRRRIMEERPTLDAFRIPPRLFWRV